MKLKFQIIDKSQKGFAKYCPSFANVYDCMIDRVRYLQVRKIARSGDVIELIARLRKNPGYVRPVARLLAEEDAKVGGKALDAFNCAANKGANIQAALPELVKALDYAPMYSKSHAASALLGAAKYGFDVSEFVPTLVLKLDVWDIGDTIALVLGYAAANEKSRNAIVGTLVDLLRNSLNGNSVRTASAIKKAIEKGNQKTLDAFTVSINHVLQSAWFMEAMARNNGLFVKASTACAEFMTLIKRKYILYEAGTNDA